MNRTKCLRQGWEFALSLICSSLFCSKLLILKSNRERCALLNRAMSVICSWFEPIALKKQAICSKFIFFVCFWQFLDSFPHWATWAIWYRFSLKKSNHDRFAQVAHDKRAIRSGCSWQKIDGSNSFFLMSKSLFRSQKTSDSLEKLMSNPTLGKSVEEFFNSKNYNLCYRAGWFTLVYSYNN